MEQKTLIDWIVDFTKAGFSIAFFGTVFLSIIMWILDNRKRSEQRRVAYAPIALPEPEQTCEEPEYESEPEPESRSDLLTVGRDSYPITLKEYIGHKSTVNVLNKLVHNYKEHSRVIEHVLFYGQGGLGKTTLSEILANEVGRGYVPLIGKQLTNITLVEKYLDDLNEGSILYIDEIHCVEDVAVLEFLYSVLQDFKLNKGNLVKHYPKFTFVGSTTDPYQLPDPLLQRFLNKFKLNPYTQEEIIQILDHCLDPDIKSITPKAKDLIARTCQGNIRLARNELLSACTREAIYKSQDEIDGFIVRDILKEKGIDPDNGLNKDQIRTLEILGNGETMGLNNIAFTVGVSPKEMEILIEPYLLKEDYIRRTSRGRVITGKGLGVIK